MNIKEKIDKWYQEFGNDSTQDFTFRPEKFTRKQHAEGEWYTKEFVAWLIKRKKLLKK